MPARHEQINYSFSLCSAALVAFHSLSYDGLRIVTPAVYCPSIAIFFNHDSEDTNRLIRVSPYEFRQTFDHGEIGVNFTKGFCQCN